MNITGPVKTFHPAPHTGPDTRKDLALNEMLTSAPAMIREGNV